MRISFASALPWEIACAAFTSRSTKTWLRRESPASIVEGHVHGLLEHQPNKDLTPL